MKPLSQAVIKALDTNKTIQDITRQLSVTRNTLRAIATSNGYDWEGRKDRIRKAGVDRRVEGMKLKARRKVDDTTRKWLRGERTMSGDMGSLMGLRMGWV